MDWNETPEQVIARWERRETFDRVQFHAEMEAAERRHGRRVRHKPRWRRRSDWLGDEMFRDRHSGRWDSRS